MNSSSKLPVAVVRQYKIILPSDRIDLLLLSGYMEVLASKIFQSFHIDTSVLQVAFKQGVLMSVLFRLFHVYSCFKADF